MIHPDESAVTYEHNCCTATTTIDENGGQSSAIRDPLLKITGLVELRWGTRSFTPSTLWADPRR